MLEAIMEILKIMGWLGVVLGIIAIVNLVGVGLCDVATRLPNKAICYTTSS